MKKIVKLVFFIIPNMSFKNWHEKIKEDIFSFHKKYLKFRKYDYKTLLSTSKSAIFLLIFGCFVFFSSLHWFSEKTIYPPQYIWFILVFSILWPAKNNFVNDSFFIELVIGFKIDNYFCFPLLKREV